MDQIPLQLDKEEIKRSEDSKRGGGGGGDSSRRRLFLILPSEGGNYLREAINRGKAII